MLQLQDRKQKCLLSEVTKIVAGAAIGEGALVGTTSAGKAVALVAGTDTTKYVVGTLLTESAQMETSSQPS
jgi:hypothetical protein